MSSSKGYESRAVQTTFSPPCSPCLVVSPQSPPVDGGPQPEISTPTVESSLQTPDNPSQNYDDSLGSYLSTPDRSLTTSRRVLKPRLTPNFPSRVTQIVSSRIISEPATIPLFSIKSQIASQQRVVTMPEDIRSQRLEKEFILYPPEYEDSPIETSNSFSISEGSSSFARADAITTDISHSSPSPSSPDSVVIIHNKYHISQAFSRQTSVQTRGKPDGDWTVWASSPPRPIPALHGPSSLPYARCPSGAEGTIIEEQDNLPRMIWGLDQDTAKPEIAPSESSSRASETAIVSGAARSVSSTVASHNPPMATNIENTTSAAEPKTRYPNFIEPIDLGPLLAPYIQERAYQPHQIDTTRATPVGVNDIPFQQKAQHERHSNKRPELGAGLKPLPRRHETYNNAKPLVTTQPVVGSSLPIIILESQPQSMSVPTKRRQSAIEIAQQYRNTQTLFQPVTQSQWSSNSSYSPVMQAIHLPTLSVDSVSKPSLSNQTRPYNHSANDVYLASSATINSRAVPTHGLHHAASLTRVQKGLDSPGSDLGSYPRPPPNTPMNALAKSRMANVTLQMNHLPASPDSPSTAIRSLQHTKGVPLNRLSHRRLSAVLESPEDQNVTVGLRPLSPPPFQQNFHLSRPLIPDGTAPSSFPNPAQDRKNYYYRPENAPDVNAALVSKEFAKLTLEPSTPGWIQSQAQPRASFVKANSQSVQRGHKAGKTGSSGRVRVPGQKHQSQGQAVGRKNRSKKVANGMVVIAA